ncbi:MAG: DUF6084 family protein [Acidimicrobiales bacterium]
MSELAFEVAGAEPDRYGATPTLILKLRIRETTGTPIHTMALKCQVRIEPQKRRYSDAEEERLLALFGETPRWGDTLRPFLWTHANLMVAGFTDETEVELPIPCTYDFEVSAAKYLHSLGDGEIPLILLFSGTSFTKGDEGALRVNPVPWHLEAQYRLPVATWRSLMDLYFPNQGWLRVPRHTLDALERYKTTEGLPTWEQTIERLLKQAES